MALAPPQGFGGGAAAPETIPLADLSDVAGTTGTGQTVVLQGSPTITTPFVGSFVNAGHDHLAAAGGGDLAAYPRLAGRAGGQSLYGGTDAANNLLLQANSADLASFLSRIFIKGDGDTDIYAAVTGNIDLRSTDQSFLKCNAALSPSAVVVNSLAVNIDFRVVSDNGTNLIATDADLDGGAGGVGLFGVTPAARPLATAELKGALASLGLLRDGSASDLDLDGGDVIAADAFLSGGITAGATITASNLRSLALIIQRGMAAATTTSASYVTLVSSVSTTFTGRPVLFLLDASAWSETSSSSVEYAIQIDAGADAEAARFLFNTTAEHHTITGMVLLTPSAGAHTINLRWRRSGGTGTVRVDGNDQALLVGIEL